MNHRRPVRRGTRPFFDRARAGALLRAQPPVDNRRFGRPFASSIPYHHQTYRNAGPSRSAPVYDRPPQQLPSLSPQSPLPPITRAFSSNARPQRQQTWYGNNSARGLDTQQQAAKSRQTNRSQATGGGTPANDLSSPLLAPTDCLPSPLLAPTVPSPDAFPFIRDVFGPCDARPQTACIVGKNFTCSKQMRPTRQTICKTFGKWQTFIYLPNQCQFVYLPINLFFCATPFGAAADSIDVHNGITGVLCYQWLFNRQCGCSDECDASDSDVEQETIQSVMRLNDVDAPSFFVENSSSESSQYSENRTNNSVPSVAELRPLDLTLRPDIQVCDTDLEGSLLAVVFTLTSVNCSPRYSFLWQIQVGNIGSAMPAIHCPKIKRLQAPR